MGIGRSAGKQVGRQLLPRVQQLAPGLTDSFVREALAGAIAGIGPLPGAAAAAETKLAAAGGDRDQAVKALVDRHVQYAGAQGFATNIGGLVTAAVTIPANITGLAVIQSRMISAIAHLRGYDLDDPRVRNAVLTCLIGEDSVRKLVRKRRIPAPPMALATAPHHDPDLDLTLSAEVAAELITRVAGKRIVTTVGRRIPVLGGVVGGGADAWATWQIGRYASRELLPRARR
ncbi:MAG: EcsC family protein [Nocardioides sp.]|nr:EcsC family protein [Nocardioides sp.]